MLVVGIFEDDTLHFKQVEALLLRDRSVLLAMVALCNVRVVVLLVGGDEVGPWNARGMQGRVHRAIPEPEPGHGGVINAKCIRVAKLGRAIGSLLCDIGSSL